jgi:uncharacterized membrane protein YgcG
MSPLSHPRPTATRPLPLGRRPVVASASSAARRRLAASAAVRRPPLLERGDGSDDDSSAATAAASPITLAVEGNIGAGKSTFLEYVTRHAGEASSSSRPVVLAGVAEPVHMWQSLAAGASSSEAEKTEEDAESATINLLQRFYDDPPRHAFTFQSYVFLTRVLQERDSRGLPRLPPPSSPPSSTAAPPLRVRVLERSVFSDRLVFVRAVRKAGWMSDSDTAVYDAYAEALLGLSPSDASAAAAATAAPAPPPTASSSPLLPDGFVYLRSRPVVCAERLARRARREEVGSGGGGSSSGGGEEEGKEGGKEGGGGGGVSLEYLESLHALHEDWLGAAEEGEEDEDDEGLEVPASIRGELRFLPGGGGGGASGGCGGSAAAGGGEMHPVLRGTPALVIDADADVFADPALQRALARKVADFAAWLEEKRQRRQRQRRRPQQQPQVPALGGRAAAAAASLEAEEGIALSPPAVAAPDDAARRPPGRARGGGAEAGGALEALGAAAAAALRFD